MFIVKDYQYKIFSEIHLRKFIMEVITNLRNKQPLKVDNLNDEELYTSVSRLIYWGMENQIITKADLEYFVNICFKYSISEEVLNNDQSVQDIFQYPDRKAADKLFLLHYHFEYGTND
jgi:hypothetical protein